MDAEKQEPFAALAPPNFRSYVTGQSLSLIGTRAETIAQALPVLHLPHPGTVLGLTTAARYPPSLLSPYAGLLADRHPRRHVQLATQAGLSLVPAYPGASAPTGERPAAAGVVLALLTGTLSAVDNPARQAFVPVLLLSPYGGCLSTGTANGTCCWPCSSAWARFRSRWSERGSRLDRPARGPPPDQAGQLAAPGTGRIRARRALLTSTRPGKPTDA